MGRPKLSKRTPSHSFTIPEEDVALVESYGDGNKSAGFRRLISENRKTMQKWVNQKLETERALRIKREKPELDYILS